VPHALWRAVQVRGGGCAHAGALKFAPPPFFIAAGRAPRAVGRAPCWNHARRASPARRHGALGAAPWAGSCGHWLFPPRPYCRCKWRRGGGAHEVGPRRRAPASCGGCSAARGDGARHQKAAGTCSAHRYGGRGSQRPRRPAPPPRLHAAVRAAGRRGGVPLCADRPRATGRPPPHECA
jgi:hypothetical protein